MTEPVLGDDPFAAAGAYRAKGWVGTLPLPHGSKWPPPEGTTGGEGRWPNGEEIAAWSARAKAQNIALRLPPNVVALDIDEPTAFAALIATLGSLPATWRAHSGGTRIGHLYYRLPPGVISQGWPAPCPGVDLLRYGHRYSVVWPSLHPGGTTYAWVRPDGSLVTDGAIPAPGELPELPAPWVDHLRGAGPASATATASTRTRTEVFGTVGDLIEHGKHQEHLFLHACSMRARGVPEPEAAAIIRHRAAHDCRPPWVGPGDPWEVVAHSYRYPEGQPAEPGLSLIGELGIPGQGLAPAAELLDPARLTLLAWTEAWEAPEAVEWVIPSLVPVGAGAVLYSAPGVGKSLLALEIAVAVSRGVPVLGAATKPRVVLYVDHENDPRGDVVRRLKAMGRVPNDLTDLRYLSFPDMAPLDTPRGGAELLDIAQRVGAELVVIDTVSRAVAGEENSNDTWNAFYRHTGRALKLNGIACLRLDHAGKDSDRGQRGGSAKSGDVDVVWRLTASTGDFEFLLTCEKDRTPIAEKVIAIRRELHPLRHEIIPTPTRETVELDMQRTIWEALDDAGAAEQLTIREARMLLRGSGVGFTNDTRMTALLNRVLKARAAQANAFASRPDWAPSPRSVADGCLTLVRPEPAQDEQQGNNDA